MWALIGIGPYGLAFIAWAHGIRHGRTRVMGAMAYGVALGNIGGSGRTA